MRQQFEEPIEPRFAVVEIDGNIRTQLTVHWTVAQAESAAAKVIREYGVNARAVDRRTGRLV